MKKILIPIIIIMILVVSCLKPPRDNEFDPNNPDKAYLTGVVHSPEGKVKHAKIELLTSDHETYDSTYSDIEGRFEFTEIDPGIYKIMAFAPYYIPIDYYPESLPAGTSDTLDLYFSAMIFNFDSDTIGTVEPFDFKSISGNWRVVEDNTAPSQPNVYNCSTQDEGLALYNQPVVDFAIGVDFRMINPSDTLGEVGLVLRLKDSINYYLAVVSQEILMLGKVENGNFIPLKQELNSISAEEWYNLWVEVCGHQFKVYFNGNLKIDTADDQFNEGKVGLWVYSQSQSAISVNFDNVQISR